MRGLPILLLLGVLALLPDAAVGFPSLLNRMPERSLRSWLRRRQDDDGPPSAATYTKIDVTGAHAWKAPRSGDKRGPCPALNSLANHGYLPRNGVVGLVTAAKVTTEIFGLGIDLSLPLSLYATLLSGDILTLSWSIGGPTSGNLLSPILGVGKGLSGSHNKYETDASVTHGDFYLFNGDVNSVQLPKFKKLLSLQAGAAVPNWTLDVMNIHRNFTLHDSISTNPYFFFGPVSGLLVSNAGHCFVPGMFANFSREWPEGRVTKEILQSFFAVHEDPHTGALTHRRGHERIPSHWHRRPQGLLSEYGTAAFAADLVRMASYNPAILKIGGNTGEVDSFAGVDLGSLTGGIYNSLDLLDPDKLVCYLFRTLLAVVPDILQGGLIGGLLNFALNLLTTTLLPLFDPTCPGIQNWNGYMLEKFPGAGNKAV